MNQQILLIDDSKPIHPLVKSLLGDDSVTVHSAFDAHDGLVLAESLHPDLILLDVGMPGVDGFEACRRIINEPATAGIPVVFLTAHDSTAEIARGLDLGATDYVTKPFKLQELQSRVRAALRTSNLVRGLESKALIDPLTHLGNRAMYDERFAAETAMRIRSGSPLSCITLDVDHFKDVNDKYGHPFGDRVLTRIAGALSDVCRIEDVACRHGGEEFVILAPQTTAEHAALLAERMRLAIAKIPFDHEGKAVSVTCSFGVAEANDIYDRSMLERADQALYQSKNNGRDRVSMAPSKSTPNTTPA